MVIEKQADEVQKILEKGYVTIAGEASNDDILMKAGIERASGLIAVVSTPA